MGTETAGCEIFKTGQAFADDRHVVAVHNLVVTGPLFEDVVQGFFDGIDTAERAANVESIEQIFFHL